MSEGDAAPVGTPARTGTGTTPAADRFSRMLTRRMRHRSRSVAVSVMLAFVAVLALYLAVEAVLVLADRPPLLASPAELVEAIAGPGAAGLVPWVPFALAGVLAVIGLVAIVLSLAPGSRSRHRVADTRATVVVDDDVLAGALSRRAAATAHVESRDVLTVVSARRATVRVRPRSGFPVARDEVAAATAALLDELAPTPRPRPRVQVATEGRIS